MSEPTEVVLCCTNRGAHRELRFGTFYRPGVRWCYRQWDEVWIDAAEAHVRQWEYVEISADRVSGFLCRRCGRDTRVNAVTLVKLLDGAAAAGVSSLDLSVLPY